MVSRTSALEYPGSGGSEQVIARDFDVATLLTGSVQRSGDRVRITAALRDAGKAEELWSETYERRLSPENLFDIQADVVRRVASALDLPLSSKLSRALSRPPTGDLEALDLYYQGLRMWDIRGPGSTRDTMRTLLLRQAVTRDSNFVAAWSLLARSASWDLRAGSAGDTAPAWRAVERTIALVPGSLEAHLASGYYRFYAQGDYPAALAQFDAADRLLPNDSELCTCAVCCCAVSDAGRRPWRCCGGPGRPIRAMSGCCTISARAMPCFAAGTARRPSCGEPSPSRRPATTPC